MRNAILMPDVSSQHSEKRSADDSGENPEKSLIQRLQKQDPNAFQELVDLHGDSIRNLVGRLMAFDPELEDVFQNTLIQIWRNIGTFRNQSSLRTWMTRIAIMQCRNHQRSVRRWMRRLQDQWNRNVTKAAESTFAKDHDDPRWELIQTAMKQLPYRDREILVLVYLQGNTIQELAATLNEKPNTLEVRLHRAKKRLKQSIATGKAQS
jgi:RNA polymerase sigma-70 factor, ECF subfamily